MTQLQTSTDTLVQGCVMLWCELKVWFALVVSNTSTLTDGLLKVMTVVETNAMLMSSIHI